MRQIALLVFDGCMASSVTGPMDLFNIANSLSSRFSLNDGQQPFNVRLLSYNDSAVRSSSGITFEPTMTLAQINELDILLIGGFHYSDPRSLQDHLQQLLPIQPYIQQLARQDSLVCGFCTGSFLLAQAGLLDKQRATTSWWLSEQFSNQFPGVELAVDELVIEAGNIWTAGATTAYSSLCISLIDKLVGHQIASQLSRVMLLDNNRLSQLPYMSVQRAMGHNDKAISDCQYWLQEQLANPINIEQMAQYCAMSQRTFIRRFKEAVKMTPASYLQQLRVDSAKQLLENTNYNLEKIVSKVGYDDVSAFRRVFTKLVHLTPQAYRKSFS